MDLVIEQKCPTCGAPIVLHEADRLVGCPFCGVRNFMVKGSTLRFLLPARPPAGVSAEDFVYIPYVRFKGCMYQCQGHEVRHAIIDTTRIAIDSDRFSLSLGLRPQAMRLHLLTAAAAGGFVGQQVKLDNIFAQAVKMTALFMLDKAGEVRHRAFIGETLSRIYLPVYRKGEVIVDAITNTEIVRDGDSWDQLAAVAVPSRQEWEPRFLSTLCPRCGAQMHGDSDALVLHCRNCETMWAEEGGVFSALDWGRVPAGSASDLAVPFWKVVLRQEGDGPLRTYADFLRITGQPVVVRNEDEQRQLSFWIPAFKLPPASFLQTAHYFTVAQKRIADGEPGELTTAYPVTLCLGEALQSLKSVLAEATLARRDLFPRLPALDLQADKILLVYLPFRDAGHDRIERQTSITIPAAALKFGRKL